jgi:hypothetical protein
VEVKLTESGISASLEPVEKGQMRFERPASLDDEPDQPAEQDQMRFERPAEQVFRARSKR